MRIVALVSALFVFASCSDGDGYRVVMGPGDAYDLFIADGAIVARGSGGLSAVRISGANASSEPLQSLELGRGARINLPQRVVISEGGATAPLQWMDSTSVVGARAGETCVVAYDAGSRDAPTHELAFLSCKDGRTLAATTGDLRVVDLIAAGPDAILVARRGDGVTRLEVVDVNTREVRWMHESKPGTGDPIVVGSEALVIGGDARVLAFSLSDGKQRSIDVRLPDGHSISAIAAAERSDLFAMATCLCVQAGAVIESRVSLVDAKLATIQPLARLPEAFAALDLLVRGKQILVVGYTNEPSKPRPSDLNLGPK